MSTATICLIYGLFTSSGEPEHYGPAGPGYLGAHVVEAIALQVQTTITPATHGAEVIYSANGPVLGEQWPQAMITCGMAQGHPLAIELTVSDTEADLTLIEYGPTGEAAALTLAAALAEIGWEVDTAPAGLPSDVASVRVTLGSVAGPLGADALGLTSWREETAAALVAGLVTATYYEE